MHISMRLLAHTNAYREQVALSAMRRAEEAKGEVAAAKGEIVIVMRQVMTAKGEVAAAQGEIAALKVDQKTLQVLLDKRTAELMRAQSCLSMRGVIGERHKYIFRGSIQVLSIRGTSLIGSLGYFFETELNKLSKSLQRYRLCRIHREE